MKNKYTNIITEKEYSYFNEATPIDDTEIFMNDYLKYIDKEFLKPNNIEFLGSFEINGAPILLIKHQGIKMLVLYAIVVDYKHYYDCDGYRGYYEAEIDVVREFAKTLDAIPFTGGITTVIKVENQEDPEEYYPYKFGNLNVGVRGISLVLMTKEPKQISISYDEAD